MFINPEDRTVYWGYRHLNPGAIGRRDPGSDEDPDLTGLERILYEAGFLGFIKFFGMHTPYESDEKVSETLSDEELKVGEGDYELPDAEINPFEYATLEDEIGEIMPEKDEQAGSEEKAEASAAVEEEPAQEEAASGPNGAAESREQKGAEQKEKKPE